METSVTENKFAVLIGTKQPLELDLWQTVVAQAISPERELVIVSHDTERAIRNAASVYDFDLVVLLPESLKRSNPNESQYDRTLDLVQFLRATKNAAIMVAIQSNPRGFSSRVEQAGAEVIVDMAWEMERLIESVAMAIEIHHCPKLNIDVASDPKSFVQWLPKQKYSTKPDYTVLLAQDHFAAMIDLIAGFGLEGERHLRFLFFRTSSELLTLAESNRYDLIYLYLGNVKWDHRAEDSSMFGAAGVLAALYERDKKPIIAFQGYDLSAEYRDTGVHFLCAPFMVSDLHRCAPELMRFENSTSEERIKTETYRVAIVGKSIGIETFTISTPIQEVLGQDYRVALYYHQEIHDWKESLIEPQLIVIYLNPDLRDNKGDEIKPIDAMRMIREQTRSPVIFLTNQCFYDLDWDDNLRSHGALGLFNFLPPFPSVKFVETLAAHLKHYVLGID
jgi:hypothetical protein